MSTAFTISQFILNFLIIRLCGVRHFVISFIIEVINAIVFYLYHFEGKECRPYHLNQNNIHQNYFN